VGGDQQQRHLRRLGDQQVQQLPRGRVRPVRILHHHQHGAPDGEGPHAAEQGTQQLLAPTLRGEVERGPVAEGGHRQQVGDQSHVVRRWVLGREQRLQLRETFLRSVARSQAGGTLQSRDHGVQGAARVLRRAVERELLVLLAEEPLPQRGGEARLADAGFAAQQHRLPVARAGAAPAAEQQLQFFLAPDEGRGVARPQRLEAALDPAFTHGTPSTHRARHALQPGLAQVGPLEQRPREPARGRVRHHDARAGHGLQPGGEVRRLAHHAAFARGALAVQVAHHRRPGGDPDARRQRPGQGPQARDGPRRGEAGAHGALGVVLVRPGPAEVGQHAVAEELGDVAALALHHLRDGAVVGRHHLAQVLGVETGRERRRAREVAEQHRQLPSLGAGARVHTARCGGRGKSGRRHGVRRLPRHRCRGGRVAERGDGVEQPAAVADRGDADLLQILGRQRGQDGGVHVVVAERRLVPAEVEATQPSRYVHSAPLAGERPRSWSADRSKTRRRRCRHP
jgi:hypothetical protein